MFRTIFEKHAAGEGKRRLDPRSYAAALEDVLSDLKVET
eukprot:CAMPEP_0175762148 /NCGR_PEP_ID=MMETSP0097-20121207/67041_1 /TAXON_ID=311494 /ORGANISM="Alexandrium monilatum, Strain CCMP3105" /LENGTH=38 /DNA_ID= /DNA_START= /DNA_END= /DNA_ORIENTATION=